MDSDNWMNGLDRLAADRETRSSGTVGLSDGAVEGIQTLEILLEAWAEGGIEGVAGEGQSAGCDRAG